MLLLLEIKLIILLTWKFHNALATYPVLMHDHVHFETITLISSVYNFNHSILLHLATCTHNYIYTCMHRQFISLCNSQCNWPNRHSLNCLPDVFAGCACRHCMHEYGFRLQFKKKAHQLKATQLQLLQHLWHLALIFCKLRSWCSLRTINLLGATLSSVAVMYTYSYNGFCYLCIIANVLPYNSNAYSDKWQVSPSLS